MLRAWPGTRRIQLCRSSVSTIECTLGGVIWKKRCISTSAGARPFTRLKWWMKDRNCPCRSVKLGVAGVIVNLQSYFDFRIDLDTGSIVEIQMAQGSARPE